MKNSYRTDLERFMRRIEFHDDAVTALLYIYDRIAENEESFALLSGHIEQYRKTGALEFGMVINDAVLSARAMKGPEYGCKMVFFLCTAMYSYPVYEAKGLTEKVWLDSMEDFRFKLNECYKMYGEWGTFVNWFGRFYSAELLAFNRLEFELEQAPRDFKNEEFDIKAGQKVINVHIPSNERIPFSKEECDKSYDLAADYFSRFFGEDEPIIFMCGSWLLFDGMKEFMPEDSNILRFASEYTVAERYESIEDLWRIFYRENSESEPENLPETTSMMRGYKALLLEGGMPGTALGYRKHVKK
ncbi:MAG: DUF5596 domain-containing protein [Clostridia bacterium]|nr:DUF5596 domain-containing protein [Clostridia bacterium]